jgi:hypothetical protein
LCIGTGWPGRRNIAVIKARPPAPAIRAAFNSHDRTEAEEQRRREEIGIERVEVKFQDDVPGDDAHGPGAIFANVPGADARCFLATFEARAAQGVSIYSVFVIFPPSSQRFNDNFQQWTPPLFRFPACLSVYTSFGLRQLYVSSSRVHQEWTVRFQNTDGLVT